MYSKLFEKGKIGNLELKNRIVMPAMGVNYSSPDGEATDQDIAYLTARAKGGTGLIITGIVQVENETGKALGSQLSAAHEGTIRSFKELADSVHTYDTKIFAQLHHAGIETSSFITGNQIVGPSEVASKAVGETPRALTIEEIKELEKAFAIAAKRCQNAGLDGVEIHGAHGYLVSSFLSPHTNLRDDEYGGSLENRMRFLLNIIGGIKAVCGPQFPVSVRMNGADHVEGGLTIEDTVKIAKKLEEAGVDVLNVSSGTYESGYTIVEPSSIPEAWKKDFAKAITNSVNIPVIAVDNIKHPHVAEALLEEGVSDFVGIGRGNIADPEWANKAKEGKDEYIRTCVGCLNCFGTISKYDRPMTCTVNPETSKEYLYTDLNKKLAKDGDGKKVVVVGAGPTGSEAAIVLRNRGYDVAVFEKNDKPGGSIILGANPPFKKLFFEYIDMLQKTMESLGIDVHYNEEVTVEKVKALDPYGVVVAIGGEPIVLGIEGLDESEILSYTDILSNETDLTGKNILVIGGGETGLETGEFLADKDNTITIVELQEEVGRDLNQTVKLLMLKRFGEKGVNVLSSTTVKSVDKENNKATLINRKTNEEVVIDCDYVVSAIGVKNNPARNEEFLNAFDKTILIGDARKPRNIVNGSREAYDKAFVF